MLGKSENITHSSNLFNGFNKKYKIFSRKINSGTRTLAALLPRYAQQPFSENDIPVANKSKIKHITNELICFISYILFPLVPGIG